MYMATIADAQPPEPQTSSNPAQMRMPPQQQPQAGGVLKLPFQLNALKNQDQQLQLLQYQQQQQQLQALRSGAHNRMLMENPGNTQDGPEPASGGDGQAKSRASEAFPELVLA